MTKANLTNKKQYECIVECLDIDFSNLTPKKRYIPGKLYEFQYTPDKRYFKRASKQKKHPNNDK
ncbi:hypothetical protein PvtlMGM1_1762 [Prevotella sp. MGM1]|nr:hypothetical protein PvtlMGM1_1762 [Prevotella sp. MGM1]